MQIRAVMALLGLAAVITMVSVGAEPARSFDTFGVRSASPHLVLAEPTTTSDLPTRTPVAPGPANQPGATAPTTTEPTLVGPGPANPPECTAPTTPAPPPTPLGPGPANPPECTAPMTTESAPVGPGPANPPESTAPTTTTPTPVGPGPAKPPGATASSLGPQLAPASGPRQEPALTSVPPAPTSSGAGAGGFGEATGSPGRSQIGSGGTTLALVVSSAVAGMALLATVAVMWRRRLRRRG